MVCLTMNSSIKRLIKYMEKFRPNPEIPHEEPTPETEMVYHALNRKKEKNVLETFTPEQQVEIKQKQQKH